MLSKGSLLEAGLGLDSLRSAMITYSCTVPLEKLLIKTRTSTFQQRSQVDSSELPTLRIRSVAGFFFLGWGDICHDLNPSYSPHSISLCRLIE